MEQDLLDLNTKLLQKLGTRYALLQDGEGEIAKLPAQYTLELAQDLKMLHGDEAVQYLIEILVDEIAFEIKKMFPVPETSVIALRVEQLPVAINKDTFQPVVGFQVVTAVIDPATHG